MARERLSVRVHPAPFWFGFGFGSFGQIVSGETQHVYAPAPVQFCSVEEEHTLASEISKLSPAWSHTAALTVDGHLLLAGFLGGCPQQRAQLPANGCQDLLAAEKYMLLKFKGSVECWSTDSLHSGSLQGNPVWKMDLPVHTEKALPLAADGYVMPRPPFFKQLPCEIRVQKLVLGLEHALLLSTDWEVFTWGSGRHGQLGHGGLENVSEPLVVEALTGMSMGAVAAGSWHSVSISVAGDLYIWGWNESGQLGFPSKKLAEDSLHVTHFTQKEIVQGKPSSPYKASQETKNTTVEEGNTERCTDQKISSLKETLRSSPKNCAHTSEFISIQAFPALLDLPQESEVLKVSCGSRHTAVVTREGHLYTWGWGAYGQLGHGDTNSLDHPRIVECFSQKQMCVKDVVCGLWNTFVLCSPTTTGLQS
ncbi:RCC1 domain-containing protein 1 isoform X1 [Pleurodeles waltl]